jgi:hypothetical protein
MIRRIIRLITKFPSAIFYYQLKCLIGDCVNERELRLISTGLLCTSLSVMIVVRLFV